jgi:hypothetical protein
MNHSRGKLVTALPTILAVSLLGYMKPPILVGKGYSNSVRVRFTHDDTATSISSASK